MKIFFSSTLGQMTLIVGLIMLLTACTEESQSTFYRSNTTPSLHRNESGEQKTLHAKRASQDEASRLSSLGYLAGYRAPTSSDHGVLKAITERIAPGYTLFTSGHTSTAFLLDREGEAIHTWFAPFQKLFPDYQGPLLQKRRRTTYWRHATLLPQGNLLAIFEGLALVKIDRDSNLVWGKLNNAHHDLEVLPNGEIVVLTRKVELRKHGAVLVDFISFLDAHGEETDRISIIDAIVDSPLKNYFPKRIQKPRADVTHTNSLQILSDGMKPFPPGVESGDILISMRHLDSIAIISRKTRKVVWAFRDIFRRQHYARVDRGSLVLFDNLGAKSFSRAIRYRWPQMDQPEQISLLDGKEHFFSHLLALAQPLANGNTLVVESEGGRIIETTDDGTIVWKYATPYRIGEEEDFIAVVSHAQRVAPEAVLGWVKN